MSKRSDLGGANFEQLVGRLKPIKRKIRDHATVTRTLKPDRKSLYSITTGIASEQPCYYQYDRNFSSSLRYSIIT